VGWHARPMVPPETRSLRVEVKPGSEPISGRLIGPGGTATKFRGWIQLVAALQEASSSGEPHQTEEESR
jgi:hypothetical protein